MAQNYSYNDPENPYPQDRNSGNPYDTSGTPPPASESPTAPRGTVDTSGVPSGQDVTNQTGQTGQPAPTAQGGAFDRTTFRDRLMSSGIKNNGDLQAWVASNPSFATGVQVQGDKVILPTGEVIDAVFDTGGAGARAAWTGTGVNAQGVPDSPAGQAGAGASIGGGGQNVAGGNNPFGGMPSWAADLMSRLNSQGQAKSQNDALMNELLNTYKTRANQTLALDKNDPAIRQQADAYSAQQERARRNYLADLAERSGPNANLRGETRLTGEQLGQNTGAFEASLIGKEIENRRSEILNALNSMTGMLNTNQQIELQKELAQLDDAAKRYGIDVSAATSKYGTDVGASTSRYGVDAQKQMSQNSLDAQWRNALLNNSQFMTQFNLDDKKNSFYQDALQKGLLNPSSAPQ